MDRTPEPTHLAGLLLVVGFVVFLTGAAYWRPAQYQQELPRALAAMGAEPRRMRWIQTWMIAGVVTTTLGLAALARVVPAQATTLATLGAALFAFGAVLMVVSLTFGLSVRTWAAAETVATGEVPAGFAALDRWAGLLMAIHMVTAYLAWACVGAALVQGGEAPAWLGWSGVAAGATCAAGFVVLRGGPFAPPILLHVYPLVVGVALLRG